MGELRIGPGCLRRKLVLLAAILLAHAELPPPPPRGVVSSKLRDRVTMCCRRSPLGLCPLVDLVELIAGVIGKRLDDHRFSTTNKRGIHVNPAGRLMNHKRPCRRQA
jgi:hypothetical protein